MRARAKRAAAWVALTLLGAAALTGLSISALSLFAATSPGRRAVASALVRIIDEQVAGHLDLDGIEVLPSGGIELRGLRVLDPDGHLVLAVGAARVFLDLTAMRSRTVGLAVELEAPSVMLEEEPGGGVSIARAFAPSRPSRRAAVRPGQPSEQGGGFPWTIHVSRIDVRGGDLWWADSSGETRLDATELDVAGRGSFGPRGVRAEIRLGGRIEEPLAEPLAIELAGALDRDEVGIPVLDVKIGETALHAVGEGDLARRSFRVAVTRLALDRAEALALVPGAPAGSDLGATAYAESDGRDATAAVRVEPAAPDGRGGRADAAVATTLAAVGSALGFDVDVDGVDPSRVAAQLPSGEVNMVARGAVSGTRVADLRGHVAASITRSRLRRGVVTSAKLVARAAGGKLEIERLTAAAPGVSLDGSGLWREGGPVSGQLGANASDLAVASRNVAALLGTEAVALGGRARVEATLEGTSAAPAIAARIDAPSLGFGTLRATSANLSLQAGGRSGAREGRLEGRIAALRDGARELARGLALKATVAGEEAAVIATAAVPGAGKEPYALTARGRFGPERESLLLSQLTLAWPGTRFALVRPAEVRLSGPRSDGVELEAGAQRVAFSGGLGRRGALDALLQVERLDLARLPPGLVDPKWGVAGELGLEARARGTAALPQLEASFSIAKGAFGTLRSVGVRGSGRWDGRARRARAEVSLRRDGGGAFDARLDVPLPLGARPGEPVEVMASARGVPLDDVVATAGGGAHVAGALSLDLALEGRVGAPSLKLEAAIEDASVEDVDALSAWVSLTDDGDRLHVEAGGTHEGRSVLSVEADAPLDLSLLLARSEAAMRALRVAPAKATAKVTGLDLSLLAGRAGVPEGMAGMVDAQVGLEGSLAAPRGSATLEVSHGAWMGYEAVAAHVDVALGESDVAASGRLAVAGENALRFTLSLGVPPERLGTMAAIRRAPLRGEAVVPSLALARAAGREVPVTGEVEGRLSVSGTPGAPQGTLDLSGARVAIQGRPLGEASLRASYSGERGSAVLRLRPSTGGELTASLAVKAALGLGAGGQRLGDAPVEATLSADTLDLGFLPAAVPGVVRTASGKVFADLRASGSLARLWPRGTLRVENAALAVTELGEWNGIGVAISVTADAVQLERLDVRRGKGRLSARGALRGLRSERAALEAHVEADAFTVTRAGMNLAKIDARVDATGSYAARRLAVEATIPRGVVRLPDRTPRTLQSLDRRSDIVVTTRDKRRRVPGPALAGPAAQATGVAGSRPLAIELHAVAPKGLFVRSDDPKVDVELKADVTYRRTESGDYAEGSVEVVRGTVAPIPGRIFTVRRGRVQFTGGPPNAAMLDVEATHDNPVAKVTVDVAGPLSKPEIVRLSSDPPLEASQIAMLIATGQTSIKPGAGSVGTLSGEEAGKAALAVLATQAFKNLVANKLPLDTVSLESGAFRTGKYVTDRVYVGYTRKFNADPAKGENEDEVQVEYRITPRWTFESRYGNAQSGDASLVWSRSY